MWDHLSHARVLKLEKLVSMHIYIYIYIYICEVLELDSSKETQIVSFLQAPDESNDVLLNIFMFTYFSVQHTSWNGKWSN